MYILNRAMAWRDRFNCYFLVSHSLESFTFTRKRINWNVNWKKKEIKQFWTAFLRRDYNKCRSHTRSFRSVVEFSLFHYSNSTAAFRAEHKKKNHFTSIRLCLSLFPWKQVPPPKCTCFGAQEVFSVFLLWSCLVWITTLWEPRMISFPIFFYWFLNISFSLPFSRAPNFDERSLKREERLLGISWQLARLWNSMELEGKWCFDVRVLIVFICCESFRWNQLEDYKIVYEF